MPRVVKRSASMAHLDGLLFQSGFGSLIQHMPCLTESRCSQLQAKQDVSWQFSLASLAHAVIAQYRGYEQL
jgi:hypothetical protein